MKKCVTPSCSNESKHPNSGLCSACYSGIHYWIKKGVTAVVRRRNKLQIFQERLEDLRPANVIHLRRKRA